MTKRIIIITVFVFLFMCAGIGTTAQSASTVRDSPAGKGTVLKQGGSSSKPDVISSISFTGNKKFTDEQLLEATQIKVGDELSWDIMKGIMERLVNFYRKNRANLSVSPNVTHNGSTIVEFIIDENGTKGDTGPYEPSGTKQEKGYR